MSYPMSHKVLFFAANPSSLARLAIDQEIRELENELRATPHGHGLTLTYQFAARPRDIQAALLREAPSIVHFSAHGMTTAASNAPEYHIQGAGRHVTAQTGSNADPTSSFIALHGSESEHIQFVSTETLRHIFQTHGAGIKLVIFNTCHSKSIALSIGNDRTCTIGVDGAIDDVAARAFSMGFYRALGYGKKVDEAFENGLNEIRLAGQQYERYAEHTVLHRAGPLAMSWRVDPLDVSGAGTLSGSGSRKGEEVVANDRKSDPGMQSPFMGQQAKSVTEGESLLIFISCSGKERDVALRFKARLRAMGHRTWHDVDDIHLGTAFDDVLDKGLRSCDAVIGLLSQASIETTLVRNEWAAAEAHGKALLLVKIGECTPPARFIRQAHVKYDPNEEEECFGRLEEELRRLAEARGAQARVKGSDTLVPTVVGGSANPQGGDAPLRSVMHWDVAMQGTVLTFADEDERIWVTNGSEVRIYELDEPTPVHRQFLDKRPWKQVFRTTWNGRMLASDWDGGLYTLGADTDPGGEPLRTAKYSSLPVHLLATGGCTLFAATWDGYVLAWDGHGLEGTSIGRVPHLPRRLLALADGGAIVVDEGGNVVGFGPRGLKRFESHLAPPVTTLWTCNVHRRKGVAAITGDHGVVLMDLEGAVVRCSEIGADPIVLAHRNDAQNDSYTALATDTRELKWLDWTSFSIIDQMTVSLPFSVRRMGCVFDPTRAKLLQVIGLSDEGALFSTCEHSLVRYESGPFDDCSMLAGGHLLLCRSGMKLCLYRNPALSKTACRVVVKEIKGSLQVGTFGELVITLENDGSIPIRRLKAVLDGENRIEPSSARHDDRIMPGGRVSLTFFVRGHATGTRVPLHLHFTMEDVAGPPSHEQRCDVQIPIHMEPA